MSAGYSGTPLPKKLGIKEGHSVAVLAAPAHFADLVAPLPAGAHILPDFDGEGPCDVIVAFVTSHTQLKVCAIDSDWSGLRFVVRKENRPKKGRS